MPATLTNAMLADLHSGSAAVSIVAYESTGTIFAPGTGQTAISFSGADQLFTLKDSLNLSSDDPSPWRYS